MSKRICIIVITIICMTFIMNGCSIKPMAVYAEETITTEETTEETIKITQTLSSNDEATTEDTQTIKEEIEKTNKLLECIIAIGLFMIIIHYTEKWTKLFITLNDKGGRL